MIQLQVHHFSENKLGQITNLLGQINLNDMAEYNSKATYNTIVINASCLTCNLYEKGHVSVLWQMEWNLPIAGS
jgi:hypothetical protein